MSELSKQQIGKCGEQQVQLELQKRGVESAPMTTDVGVDLLAFSARSGDALTILVRANGRPKRAGGTRRPTLDLAGPLPALMRYWFGCPHCRQRFELAAETCHGIGGAWRAIG